MAAQPDPRPWPSTMTNLRGPGHPAGAGGGDDDSEQQPRLADRHGFPGSPALAPRHHPCAATAGQQACPWSAARTTLTIGSTPLAATTCWRWPSLWPTTGALPGTGKSIGCCPWSHLPGPAAGAGRLRAARRQRPCDLLVLDAPDWHQAIQFQAEKRFVILRGKVAAETERVVQMRLGQEKHHVEKYARVSAIMRQGFDRTSLWVQQKGNLP